MITRLDDELHALLKERAAAANRSVNDLVIEYLAAALDVKTTRRAVRDRARATGRLVTPEQPVQTEPRESVVARTRGAGTAASSALDMERNAR
jgi:plasmid stability protein